MNLRLNNYPEGICLQERSILTTLYQEQHRHYHNLSHVHTLLGWFVKYQAEIRADLEAEFNPTYTGALGLDSYYKEFKHASDLFSFALARSIWFHDSIYNVSYPPGLNETLSAHLHIDGAHSYFNNGSTWLDYRHIKSLILSAILATACYKQNFLDFYPSMLELEKYHNNWFSSYLIKYMLDLDLLGFSFIDHAQNASLNIRKECSMVTDKVFSENRIAFLRSMLEKPQLYYTKTFSALESAARINIQREIEERWWLTPARH